MLNCIVSKSHPFNIFATKHSTTLHTPFFLFCHFSLYSSTSISFYLFSIFHSFLFVSSVSPPLIPLLFLFSISFFHPSTLFPPSSHPNITTYSVSIFYHILLSLNSFSLFSVICFSFNFIFLFLNISSSFIHTSFPLSFLLFFTYPLFS